MKCFFHSADFDGKCSAAIVKYFNPECELIPMYYGKEFPWDWVKPNEVVYMVDFCLQPFDEMVRLANSCQKLVWLDHHISAIKAHDDLWKVTGFHIAGVRNTKQAACEIVWTYFSERPIPYAVRLLGRYDIWDLGWDVKVLPFQYGMRSMNMRAEDPFWAAFFVGDSTELIEEASLAGQHILTYIAQDYDRYMKRCGFVTEFEGYRALCVNRGFTSSHIFDRHFDPEKHDIMICFSFSADRNWRVTLYTEKDDIDCSVIASKYGGGGHAKASGFQCAELPFPLYKESPEDQSQQTSPESS